MIKWELVSFVRRSSQRRKILETLNKPITPSQIARETKMYITHVSRTLKELVDKGLVECLTPKERVEKYYKITTLGKDILKQLIQFEKE